MPASDKHTVTHGDVGNTGVIFIGVMVPEKWPHVTFIFKNSAKCT
jgi:hypothetical protein